MLRTRPDSYVRARPSGFHPLRVDLVSIYIDQCPKGEPVEDSLWGTGDIGTELAATHGVPIYSSINLALCCGGSELVVDGVILIGEHGDYPWNEKGQHLFPRKYFMEQILGVFASCGRSVPVFNDKHLSCVNLPSLTSRADSPSSLQHETGIWEVQTTQLYGPVCPRQVQLA